MKLPTILLIFTLVAVAVFLIRRALRTSSHGYRRRFDNTPQQQDSSYLYLPVVTGGGADGAGHHDQGADCGSGTADAGSGCSDGGGGN
jgi:hypothetical protein